MNTQTLAPGKTKDLASTKAPQNSNKPASRSGARTAPQAPVDGRKEVFFQFSANAAKEVLLAGDFTGWQKTPIKLSKGEQGDWIATVKLAPGQYHYKFVVDGQWQDDPASASRCPNPFGTSDSVLEIS